MKNSSGKKKTRAGGHVYLAKAKGEIYSTFFRMFAHLSWNSYLIAAH